MLAADSPPPPPTTINECADIIVDRFEAFIKRIRHHGYHPGLDCYVVDVMSGSKLWRVRSYNDEISETWKDIYEWPSELSLHEISAEVQRRLFQEKGYRDNLSLRGGLTST